MSEIAFHEKAGRSQGNSGFIVSFLFLSLTKFFSRRVAAVAMLPSALSRSDLVARCMLGVLGTAGAAICLATYRFTQEWNEAQAINAVTGTRLWLLSFLFLERF
jgi:hypothetical protein